jgi:hypothetical protein
MEARSSSTSSSSADILADITRLIAPADREGFHEMLQHELRGRELPDSERRRVGVNTWHKFVKYGWPRRD